MSQRGNRRGFLFRQYSADPVSGNIRDGREKQNHKPTKIINNKKTSTKGAVLPPTFGEIKGSGYAITHFSRWF